MTAPYSTRIANVVCLLLLGAAAIGSGCARWDDHAANAVNRWRAYSEWRRQPEHPGNHAQRKAYGCGWREGFYDVESGDDGEPPLLPPNKYWKIGYRSPEGQAIVDAWFEGYRHGATAAENLGMRQWSFIGTERGPLGIGMPMAIHPDSEHPIEAPAEEVPSPEPNKTDQPQPDITPEPETAESATTSKLQSP